MPKRLKFYFLELINEISLKETIAKFAWRWSSNFHAEVFEFPEKRVAYTKNAKML